jgi:DmsE family decaheme c-type cytochrome
MSRVKFSAFVLLAALVVLTISWDGVTTNVFGTSSTGADNSVCEECHEDYVAEFGNNLHGRIKAHEAPGKDVGCVSCHDGAMEHAEEGDADLITSFGEMSNSEAADTCLSCHATNGMNHWNGSAHEFADLSCTDCHGVHGNNGLGTIPNADTCYTCHGDVEAEMMLPSHHPVKEGKLNCASCHDPHGSPVDGMIKSDERLNDLCFNCHSAMQGPFIFEHAPVSEDCTICHNAHGTVADNLLTENEPYLCLQCHDFHFHTAAVSPDVTSVVQLGTAIPNPHATDGWKMSFATKCTQCHPSIHGTDLPSQSTTGQGKSFTR